MNIWDLFFSCIDFNFFFFYHYEAVFVAFIQELFGSATKNASDKLVMYKKKSAHFLSFMKTHIWD